MSDRVAFIASILVVIMFVINGGLILSNRQMQEAFNTKQAELNGKNTRITQNATFANINQSLIQALSTAAIARKDEQVKALLIQNGVDLSGKAAPAAPAAN